MANEDLKARTWTGVLFVSFLPLLRTLSLTCLPTESPIATVPLDPIPSEYNTFSTKDMPEHVKNFQPSFAEKFKAGLSKAV